MGQCGKNSPVDCFCKRCRPKCEVWSKAGLCEQTDTRRRPARRGISDYFYGDEAEQFIYFRIPRQLITDPRFKHLSTDAKLLYGMLLDRMSLSVKNGWYDEDGRVYGLDCSGFVDWVFYNITSGEYIIGHG